MRSPTWPSLSDNAQRRRRELHARAVDPGADDAHHRSDRRLDLRRRRRRCLDDRDVNHDVPVSDDDWLKVERGFLMLAEASNLLKMPRPVAPAGSRRGTGRAGEAAAGVVARRNSGDDRPGSRPLESARRRSSHRRPRSLALVKTRDPESALQGGRRPRQRVRGLSPGVLVSRRQTCR